MLFTVSSKAQKITEISWSIAAEFPSAIGQEVSLGVAGPVTGVYKNIFFVGGGANFPDAMPWNGGKKKYYNSIYAYQKNKHGIIILQKKFLLPSPIAYTANCSTPQGFIFAGGENENGISNKVYLLEWDKKEQNIITKSLPDLPLALTNAAAVYHNNTIYLAGGETKEAVSDKLFCLQLNDLSTGWKQVSGLPKPISHTVLLATENKLYLVGGRKKNPSGISDLYSSVFEFNILTNQCKEIQPLPYALSAGTGVVFKNNLYMFGGDKGETFHKTEELIAAINAEKDSLKKQQLILQKNELQQSHPGFSKAIQMFNTKTNKWSTIGELPFTSPVTTTAVKIKNDILIPCGEIRAGVRTPNILFGEIK